jgi:hypothetical protein
VNEQQARVTANIVMMAAAAGAAVAIPRSPTLRRFVAGLAKASAGPLAAFAMATVRDAWEASGPRAHGHGLEREPFPAAPRGDAPWSK